MDGFLQDWRQPAKVRHKLKDIVVIVLLATLANAESWEEIGDFAKYHEEYLRKYIELPNGVPSHDTIQRVMAMIAPEQLLLPGAEACESKEQRNRRYRIRSILRGR